MNKLLSIILVLLATTVPTYSHTYILCVGVADYPGTNNDLRLSATDAQTISHLYKRNTLATALLLQNAQATVEKVAAAFSELCSQASEDDTVVFFFSGHGTPGAFVCYNGYLKYDKVVAALANSHARQKMIFADACFAGKARRSQRRSTAEDYSQTSVLFFLSSRTDETSLEDRKMNNSLFTAYLERGLRGGADTNLDRTITARELFVFVSEGVQQKSQQRQHPVMWGRFDDDMPIMSW